MPTRLLLALALIATFAFSNSYSAEAVPAAARQLIKDYEAAIKRDGLAATARYLHPDAQRAFRQEAMGALRGGMGDSLLHRAFGKDATLELVEKMPDSEFVEKFFGATDDQFGGLGIQSIEIVGVVQEGELLHLVTRTRSENYGSKTTAMSLVSLKQYRDQWRMLLLSTSEKTALPPPPPPPPPPPIPPPRR